MAEIQQPDPVKLVCGLLAGRREWLDAARERLCGQFGQEDTVSDVWPFTFTSYYESQMGPDLLRQFVSYGECVDPGRLDEIKRTTNRVEADLAAEPDANVPRPVNLDPGYVTESRLVLASMKDFSHRVYIGGGVFGEVTLQYRSGWQSLPWTFPDYASGLYDGFLTTVRNRLRQQHKEHAT